MVRMRALLAVMVLEACCCRAQLGPRSRSVPNTRPYLALSLIAMDGKVPGLAACPAHFDDSLETNGIAPEYKAAGVTLPKLIHFSEAEFSERARKEINKKHLRPFESVSTIEMVVGTDGRAGDLCVMHAAAFDLDEQAAKVVRQYQFEPAMKDGQPVKKRLKVEIRFRMQ